MYQNHRITIIKLVNINIFVIKYFKINILTIDSLSFTVIRYKSFNKIKIVSKITKNKYSALTCPILNVRYHKYHS